MHIHIYAYVYLYIYILIYVYIYSSALHTYIYTHVYIYTYIHIYLYIYPWAYPPTLFFHPLSSSTHSLFSPSYTSESARLRTPTLLSCCAAVLVSWLTQMSAMTLSHVWHHPCIYTYTSIHQHYTFECYDTSFECYDTFIMSAMTLSHVWHHPWVMYHVAGACPRDPKWYSTPSPNLSPYIFLGLNPSPPPLTRVMMRGHAPVWHHPCASRCRCVPSHHHSCERWGAGVETQKMYGERLGDGVEYHLMSPTPRC